MRVRQVDAGAIVQQPAVVLGRHEIFEHVGVDRIDREDEARYAQPVRKNQRPLVAAAVTCQPQDLAVFRAHQMNLGLRHAQRPLLARIEHVVAARARQDAAVGVEQLAAKEGAELADGAHAVGSIAPADAAQGLHLHVEVGRRNLEQTARDAPELPLGALGDIDVEPRRIAPQVERSIRAHDLVADELVLGAVAGAEREIVVEALGLHRVLVDAHQIELAVEDLHGVGRQRRALDRANNAAGVLLIGHEPIDVVDQHRQREAAGVAFLFAAPRCRLVRQRDCWRDEASHALGELDAGRLKGLAAARGRYEHR